MIVSHQAVLRLLYAYLMGLDREDSPRLEIPLHTVIKLTCAPPSARPPNLDPRPRPALELRHAAMQRASACVPALVAPARLHLHAPCEGEDAAPRWASP